jgi:hypothetical protein
LGPLALASVSGTDPIRFEGPGTAVVVVVDVDVVEPELAGTVSWALLPRSIHPDKHRQRGYKQAELDSSASRSPKLGDQVHCHTSLVLL